MMFCVSVPVLSENTYLIWPRSSGRYSMSWAHEVYHRVCSTYILRSWKCTIDVLEGNKAGPMKFAEKNLWSDFGKHLCDSDDGIDMKTTRLMIQVVF